VSDQFQFQSQPYPSDPYRGGVTTAIPYASWIQRVGAALIDYAPIFVLEAIFFRWFAIRAIFGLIGLGWTIYNRWYQAGTTGQSLGKKVLGLRLVSEETGQPIGMAMAFVRDLCHFIDSVICYVGYLFPLWDAKRQTIADKIVRTVVISA
jgi:uncharacterized RDD family membrane protein YckC